MRFPTIDEWVEALESGEFKQGKNGLHDLVDDTYCCLGVLCKLAELPEKKIRTYEGSNEDQIFSIFEFDGRPDYYWYPPSELMRAYGMNIHGKPLKDGFEELAVMNDRATPFSTIAATIRRWKSEGKIHDPH